MNKTFKNISVRLSITIAILVFLILINVATATMARYTTSFGEELNFVANAKRDLGVLCGEWEQTDLCQKLSFNISCKDSGAAATQDATARVRLYIPSSTELPSEIVIVSGGEQYTARILDIPVKTAAYKAYGEGKMACFYDSNGNEIALEIPQSSAQSTGGTLLLYSTATDTTGMRVIVESVSEQKIVRGDES